MMITASSTKFFRAGVALLAFGGCFYSSAANTLAQDFHVKGEIEYRYYSEVYTREFEFYVKGNAWQLVVSRNLPDIVFPGPKTLLNGRVIEPPNVPGRKPGDKIAEEVRDYFVMGGDSLEEHYYFERRSAYYTESIAPALPGAPPPPARPAGKRLQEMVRIYPGPVPWESREKCLPYLWLAFGSRPYFESLKSSKVMPFYNEWAQRWGVRGYQQEIRWQLADSVPRLPRVVSYLNPGEELIRKIENGKETTNLVFVPYSAPYNRGFTNAHYAVLATTNFGGLTVPVEFQFDEFVPAGGGGIRPVRTVRGKVQTLYAYCPKKSLKLEFPDGAIVLDERIRINLDMKKIPTYKSSRWLTTNEAFALLERQKNPPPPAAANAKPKPTPWWQGIAVIAALALPGLLIWWRVRARRAISAGGGK